MSHKDAATQRRYNQRERELRRKLIVIAAKDVPCADCGVKYPTCVMQFDHVRGEKKFNIGGGVRGISSIIAEIAKCEVVCANCHALRTWMFRAPVAQ
jgi:hypothetical protein